MDVKRVVEVLARVSRDVPHRMAALESERPRVATTLDDLVADAELALVDVLAAGVLLIGRLQDIAEAIRAERQRAESGAPRWPSH